MIRKITKQHLREASEEPVYKVVMEEKNGRLRSLWVVGTKKRPDYAFAGSEDIPIYALTYKPDRVISDGRYGIWCCKTFEDAVCQASWNGYKRLCQVHKAYPIGMPIKPPPSWGHPGTVLYPAVIMGECVKTIDNRR